MTHRTHAALVRLTLIAALLASLSARAENGEDPALTRARNTYQYGDYDAAITQLRELLYPLALEREEDQVAARELLGVLYYVKKQTDAARAEFLELLRLDPEHRLNPLLYPPSLVEFYDALRAEIAVELERIREEQLKAAAEEARRAAEEEARRAAAEAETRTVFVDRPYRRNTLALAFVPFGIGQFQNGEIGKGVAFLTGELALLGLNIASYQVVVGLQNKDGTTPRDDVDLAEAFRITQMVSLGALVALAVYGVVDAYLNFRPYTELEASPEADEESAGRVRPTTDPREPLPNGPPAGTGLTLFRASWRF